MDPELLRALRALTDASRLRVVGLLAVRAMALEELAALAGLQPGAVRHHLERLQGAGLVEGHPHGTSVAYALKVDRLQQIGRLLAELDTAREAGAEQPGPDGEPRPVFDAAVLRAFLRGGRLTSIPAQGKKREVVVRYLVDRCFEAGRIYGERDVNERLGAYHEDTASLRRQMVDSGLLVRSDDGSEYRRA